MASSPRKTPPATPEVCERTARAGRKPTVGRPAGSRTGSEGTGSCDRDRRGQGGPSHPARLRCARGREEDRAPRVGGGAGAARRRGVFQLPSLPRGETCKVVPSSLAAGHLMLGQSRPGLAPRAGAQGANSGSSLLPSRVRRSRPCHVSPAGRVGHSSPAPPPVGSPTEGTPRHRGSGTCAAHTGTTVEQKTCAHCHAQRVRKPGRPPPAPAPRTTRKRRRTGPHRPASRPPRRTQSPHTKRVPRGSACSREVCTQQTSRRVRAATAGRLLPSGERGAAGQLAGPNLRWGGGCTNVHRCASCGLHSTWNSARVA